MAIEDSLRIAQGDSIPKSEFRVGNKRLCSLIRKEILRRLNAGSKEIFCVDEIADEVHAEKATLIERSLGPKGLGVVVPLPMDNSGNYVPYNGIGFKRITDEYFSVYLLGARLPSHLPLQRDRSDSREVNWLYNHERLSELLGSDRGEIIYPSIIIFKHGTADGPKGMQEMEMDGDKYKITIGKLLQSDTFGMILGYTISICVEDNAPYVSKVTFSVKNGKPYPLFDYKFTIARKESQSENPDDNYKCNVQIRYTILGSKKTLESHCKVDYQATIERLLSYLTLDPSKVTEDDISVKVAGVTEDGERVIAPLVVEKTSDAFKIMRRLYGRDIMDGIFPMCPFVYKYPLE